jgi:hypothetical protein
VTLTFACSAQPGSCNGVCGLVGFNTTKCGPCMTACPANTLCEAGACGPYALIRSTVTQDCTTVCSAAGQTCSPTCTYTNGATFACRANYGAASVLHLPNCSDVPPSGYPSPSPTAFAFEDCCCMH